MPTKRQSLSLLGSMAIASSLWFASAAHAADAPKVKLATSMGDIYIRLAEKSLSQASQLAPNQQARLQPKSAACACW